MPANMLKAAQDRYWYAFGQNFPPEQMRENVYLAFTAGARWSTRETSALSPHIARFIEMMILLGYLDNAEDPALESERNSPLWRTAGVGTPGDSAEPPY